MPEKCQVKLPVSLNVQYLLQQNTPVLNCRLLWLFILYDSLISEADFSVNKICSCIGRSFLCILDKLCSNNFLWMPLKWSIASIHSKVVRFLFHTDPHMLRTSQDVENLEYCSIWKYRAYLGLYFHYIRITNLLAFSKKFSSLFHFWTER